MGQPDSDPNLEQFAFIFLVALGVDDNVFLLRAHPRGARAARDDAGRRDRRAWSARAA